MRHRLDKDILFQKFIVEDKSASTVAEELNTTVSSVYYHLSKFSIRKGVLKHGKYVFLHVTEEEFERLYTIRMPSANQKPRLEKNSSKAQRLSKAPTENREASRVVASATKCEGSGEPEHDIV